MLWFPIHRKHSIFDQRRPFHQSLIHFRRFEPKLVVNFIWFIMSFWLLAFSVKIGITLFFSTTGMNESDLAFSLINIELPLVRTAEHIDNKRLCFYVSVEKSGRYRIGKYYYEPDDLKKHLYNLHRSLPNVIICIVADKDCKMEDINNLLIILRKSSTQRLSFICRENRKGTTQAFN